ncbi:ligase-associated DNA damage response endonuclease PdeM [Flavobacterium sp. J372]|uniref:ligase-associated DNA damage response endonuclease PdeM n=1 Tax=Flavobacterium sp. J372 TaxID=2898436 RepID=UPI002150904E|nr:ligase-associated DNA damage response endonuclease PdeM [Flavobacterium sp. J372]MCR5861012.1 ligase-associated DNA damage response endonuclease PdeM [Flavobacterium sp. J372]
MTLEIDINGRAFVLHCSGALYWVEKRMLLISDVHLGKISHFRKHGSALPDGAIYKNFLKLDNAVEYFNPEVICFLGDLFHSTLNNEWQLFTDWVNATRLPIILVAGNHDIINPKKYHDLEVQVVSEWVLDGFLLTHHPEEREGLFTLSGHIHPAVLLSGMGRQFVQLPCFFRSPAQMILPAFGEFTGTYVLEPQEHDIIYAITKEDVVLVTKRQVSMRKAR